MAKVTYSQNSFVGGALDPTLFGRTDISNYHVGAAVLENVVVLPQGGVKRRPGLEYIAQAPAGARLIPFVFNDQEQYLFVLSAGLLEIYHNHTLAATLSQGALSALSAEMLLQVNWAQSNDVLFLVHPDVAPIEIARTNSNTWSATPIAFENIPPFAFTGIMLTNPAVACTPSGLAGHITLTTAQAFWHAGHVGQFVNIHDGRVFIEEVTSPTQAKGIVRVELITSTPAAAGSWSTEEGYEPVMSASRGWPRSVSFHQGRLVFGGLKSRPQTLLFSKVGVFFNFDLGDGAAADGIDVTIDDDRANVIRNIFSGRGLQIFTTGGEFFAAGSTSGEGITPENVTIRRGTFHGCNHTRPESVDGATLFVESNGRVIRSFLFSDVEQAFATDDITLMSAHLLQGIKHMALRRSTVFDGANFLFVVNEDGSVAVLNTLRSQNLRAWSHFTTAGHFADVAVVGEETYFLVKRTTGGAEVHTIEVLNPALLVDCGTYQTAENQQNTWLGFNHLEGETITLLGDGYAMPPHVVTQGAVTLAEEGVQTLQAGLGFNVRVETLPPVPPFRQELLGQPRRLIAVSLFLEKTGQITLQSGKTRVQPAFRSFGAGVLDAAQTPYSGWLKVPLGGVGRMPTVQILQTTPAPFHLLSITFDVGV